MKKLLITGGNGFLGVRLAAACKERYDVLTPSHRQMDFTRPEEVRALFDSERPEWVIHCAAISDTGCCEQDPEMSHRVNVEAAAVMAGACAAHDAKMIFCSSDQIYFSTINNTAIAPHTEMEAVHPANVYGRHKLEAEQRIREVCPDAVCLRLSWMYDNRTLGPNEHGDLFRMVLTALRDNRPLRFPIHDFRCITYVRDVIDNMEKAFHLPGGIYNFGSSNERNTFETVEQLVRILASSMTVPANLLHPDSERFASSPRNLVMDNRKVRQSGICFPTTVEGFRRCEAEMDD